jgi:hypothetical protein
MASAFVRKDFYILPPEKDADPTQWKAWLKADNNKARGAKAAFTRAQKAEECTDPRLNRAGMVRQGGVWRQSVALWSGSAEEGTLVREVAVEATQEADLTNVRRLEDYRHARGNRRKNRNKNKRAGRKARRKARFV